MYRTPSPSVASVDDAALPKPATAPQPARKAARFETAGLRVHWARFKHHLSTGSALSESVLDATAESTEASSTYRRYVEKNGKPPPGSAPVDDGPVDEVVVDNQSVTQPSEAGDNRHLSGDLPSHQHNTETRLNSHGIPASDSYFEGTVSSFWDRSPILVCIRYRILPFLWRFFNLSFHDPEAEAHYLKERYYTKKRLAFFASLFFILNWVLACALVPRPFETIDYVFYYGIATAMTIPGPFLIIFDGYRRAPVAYQIWLTLQTYMWAFYNLLFIHLCGFYGQHSYWPCGRRDFLGLFYYSTGLPVLALFGMHQHRFPAFRSCFTSTLCTRLQSAQVSERKAADSKRRLTSYIFHEVRVPLNTALLATQNMAAAMTLSGEHDVEFNALEGSLSMMSKVLNDVLDFNRMDRHVSVSKPYAFHTVMRSMLVPLRLAADARGLELVSEFDPAIDETIRKANRWDEARRTAGDEKPKAEDEKITEDDEEEEAIVIGDEMRLRQIITNLASNAAKFTESGGKIFIRTKLVSAPTRPNPLPSNSAASGISGASAGLGSTTSSKGETAHDEEKATVSRDMASYHSRQSHHSSEKDRSHHNENGHARERQVEQIVVRIEVEDTGVGIRRKDLVDNRLFSAFNQTEVGRLQGGKGTGLGLALVRHIVKLSGGRLGVKSQRDIGSMFWVELSLGVGRRVNNALARNKSKDDALTNIARSRIIERSGFVLDASQGVGGHHDITPSTIVSTPSDIGFVPTLPIESNAALKTIMEHGGMVELASRRPRAAGANDVPIVVTRTMGKADTSVIANAVTSPITSPTEEPDNPTDETTAPAPAISGLPAPDLTVPEPTPPAGTPTVQQRPGFVTMPSRKKFDFPPSDPSNDKPGSTGSVGSGSTIAPNVLNVLVVDDDPLTRKLMTRMLTRLGCVCDTAENGLLALELLLGPMAGTPSSGDLPPSSSRSESPVVGALTTSKYAVVFLDNQYVSCGLEVMRQLRSLGRQDFVVGVTGNALKEDQEEYYEAGVDQVLTKPVLERSLKQMLVMADERRRAQRTATTPAQS
ncbi:protein-histidine kinase [Ceratobasidium sp. AG-Ba]|nr:protein-histidine kinase [Ceratobasidium sp. AG-Ba]